MARKAFVLSAKLCQSIKFINVIVSYKMLTAQEIKNDSF